MKSGKFVGAIAVGIHWLSKICGRISAAVIFLMMLLVAADVIGRYVFNKPIKGAMEIDELMMVVVVFLVLAFCTLERGHIRVELLVSRFSEHTQAILESITYLTSLGITVLIAWQMGTRGWQELWSPSGGISLLLGIPQAPLILLATVGCVLLSLELLIFFLQSLAQVTGRRVDI